MDSLRCKKKLVVSTSGGRTSAFMLWWIFKEWEDRDKWEKIAVFANTGKEQEGTLQFIKKCSERWSIDIVWVEAKHKKEDGKYYSGKGWSVSHRIVDYDTAARNGEPFEEMLSVLGVPSTNAPFCSEQLKKRAIESYLKSIGWTSFYKAIGIRMDEVSSRINKNFKKNKIFYPLISHKPMNKRDIVLWWVKQDFDLEIDPDLGNCDGCWKKDIKILVRIGKKKPFVFNWWQQMTDKYGDLNPRMVELKPPFNFYRGNMSPKDILKMAASYNNLTVEQINMFSEIDNQTGCGESCEAF